MKFSAKTWSLFSALTLSAALVGCGGENAGTENASNPAPVPPPAAPDTGAAPTPDGGAMRPEGAPGAAAPGATSEAPPAATEPGKEGTPPATAPGGDQPKTDENAPKADDTAPKGDDSKDAPKS